MKKELTLEPTQKAKKVASAAKAAMLETVQTEKKEASKQETVKKEAGKLENTKVETAKKEAANVEKQKVETANKGTALKRATTAKANKPEVKEGTAKEIKKVEEAKNVVSNSTELYLQFQNKEISVENIYHKVKDAYTASGNTLGKEDKVRVYIKPEENMIYYVVNDKYTSGVSLY